MNGGTELADCPLGTGNSDLGHRTLAISRRNNAPGVGAATRHTGWFSNIRDFGCGGPLTVPSLQVGKS